MVRKFINWLIKKDMGITDRYKAMAYGFEQAMERVLEAIENID